MRPTRIARIPLALLVASFFLGGSAYGSIQGVTPRSGHTVTELNDGRLLIAGGEDENGLVGLIEVFDPAIGANQVVGTLTSPRKRHAAVRLQDGRVLLVGGEGVGGILDTAEVVNPLTGASFSIALSGPRADHTATLLGVGTVLVAGGTDGTDTLGSVEIFNPSTNAVSAVSALLTARQQHTATMLDDGRVLLIGGRSESGALTTTEYWDPATGAVTSGPAMVSARFGHTATRILHGHVAVVGGSDGSTLLASGEIYCKDDRVFHSAANGLGSPRVGHSAVALPESGHLMIVGGRSTSGPVATVELLHPSTYTFAPAAGLQSARAEFGLAIAMSQVWVVGGNGSAGTAQGSVEGVPFGTLTTDHDDYPPNTMVTFSGAGWLPGEQVEITIQQSDGDPDTVLTSVADAEGRIVNTDLWTAADDGGVTFTATAVGATSGRAAFLQFYDSHFLNWVGPSPITQTTSPVTLYLSGGNFTVGNGVGVNASGPGGSGTLSIASRDNFNINVTLPLWVTNVPGTYAVWVTQYITNHFCHWHYVNPFYSFYECHSSTSSHNSGSRSFSVVPPDNTPPFITPNISGTLGANGWYVSNISVNWSVSDPQSGISSTSGCSTVNISTDTAGTTLTCTATSAGGTSSQSVTIKRDASPPTAALAVFAGTLGNNGWHVSNVTVRTSGADTLSGPVTCTADQFQTTDTAGTSFYGSCTNQAGLTKGVGPIVVKLDKTPPSVTAAATTLPNAFGWYQGNVTVAFTCADALSGVSVCPANQTLSAEGTAVVSTAQVATDAAGNTSAPSNIVSVKIDKTLPLVTLSGGPVSGGSYYFGAVPAAPTCSASDALSGLQGTCTVSGYGTTVGPHTVTATATDKAGNQNVASATYAVLPWTLSGFYQPVDMGDVVNTIRNGSTVPLKFEVFAGTIELTDSAIVVQPLTATEVPCVGGVEDQIELVATGGTNLRYDATEGQFIYNWQTPRKANYCYVVTVVLSDGTTRSARFKLR